MELRLFLRRLQIDSTFIFSLMNHNKLNFALFVENSLASYRITQKEVPSADALPLLEVVKKKGPSVIYKSREEIVKYLSTQNYLKRGISHSAWESQSYVHLLEKTYPMANGLSKGAFKRFQQTTRRMSNSNSGDTIGMLQDALKDTIKLTYNDWRSGLQYTPKSKFIEEIKDWEKRLNQNPFHGGTIPDKADFFMYSCIEANWILLKDEISKIAPVWLWKQKMDSLSDQSFL